MLPSRESVEECRAARPNLQVRVLLSTTVSVRRAHTGIRPRESLKHYVLLPNTLAHCLSLQVRGSGLCGIAAG